MTQTDSAASDSSSESVGSVAEEAFKLFRALAGDASTGEEQPHVCTAAWCPVCQVVGFVKDNPEAVEQLSQSAAQFTRSLRDLIDTAMTPKEES